MPQLPNNDGWRETDISTGEIDDTDSLRPVQDEQDEEGTFSSFDSKWQRAFEGLTYLGHLEKEVKIPYHSFVVRTLTTGEKIKVTELIHHLENSIGYARAYRAAVVAAALVLVDGQPLLVGSRKVDAISQKYQYLIDNWYDFVIDTLYESVNELEGNVIGVLKELGVYDDKRTVAQVESAIKT